MNNLMNTVGPWILLAIGVVICLGMVRSILRDPAHAKSYVTALTIGAALAGVGVYGLAFLDPFSRVLSSLTGAKTPEEKRAATIDALGVIAKGRLRPGQQELLMPYLLNQPVGDMTNLMQGAIAKATTPTAAQILSDGLRTYEAKRAAGTNLAVAVVQGHLNPTVATNLDFATRRGLVHSLESFLEEPGHKDSEAVKTLNALTFSLPASHTQSP
jgi:hypothetical protein